MKQTEKPQIIVQATKNQLQKVTQANCNSLDTYAEWITVENHNQQKNAT